jgi:hypothetical protein
VPASPAGRAGAVATRRRGDALRGAVFDQLRIVGYANLTMDRVASAAGTSKTVLYRRWATKEDMIADALRHRLPPPGDIPLTGDLRTDVHALLRCVQASFSATRGTAFQLVSAEAGCGRPAIRHPPSAIRHPPSARRSSTTWSSRASSSSGRSCAARPSAARSGPRLPAN